MIKEIKFGLKVLIDSLGEEVLLVESNKLKNCIEVVKNYNIRKLSLDYEQGYKLSNINFLLEIKDLVEGLFVSESLFDYMVIKQMENLKHINIPDLKKLDFDFSYFPQLITCGLSYNENFIGLDKCFNLSHLTINNFNPKTNDLNSLPNLSSLRKLTLIKPKLKTINGISKFQSLTNIEIYNASKLENIDDLGKLNNSLQELIIENSRNINDFKILLKMNSLIKLVIIDSGSINSISFIEQMPLLKFFSFRGTNIMDGNLSFCCNLEYVGFDNKKHYSHRMEQFTKKI